MLIYLSNIEYFLIKKIFFLILMESQTSPQIEVNFANEKYTDVYMEKLIALSFGYYDHHNDKEKFESCIESLIGSFVEQIKPIEIKTQLKFLIDFIGKYANADMKFVETALINIGMKPEHIDNFKSLLIAYHETISTMKRAIIEKVSSHRIVDFSHSFNVKFCDSLTDKVDFVISLLLKYYDDDEEIKKIELDLSLNQFYSIYNELQKIDTMIRTLI